MSWFKPQRWSGLAAAVAAAVMLSACSSLTPVYGNRGAGETHPLRQEAPGSATDQIVYQALALSFPSTESASAPLLQVSTSASERALTKSNVARPLAQSEMIVTASVKVVAADGSVIDAFSRSAAASFETDSQGFASASARREATERAARAVAETIRLSLMSLFAARGS